ncbi:hypothetical protein BS47DRAFT_1340957, partial [Hydnum rufescens UP504]
MHSYSGYGLENQQSQAPLTSSARVTPWPDPVVADAPDGSTSTLPYHPPAPMLESHSAPVVAKGLVSLTFLTVDTI